MTIMQVLLILHGFGDFLCKFSMTNSQGFDDHIGVRSARGVQGLEYWGGGGGKGPKFPAGTWRRNGVDAT